MNLRLGRVVPALLVLLALALLAWASTHGLLPALAVVLAAGLGWWARAPGAPAPGALSGVRDVSREALASVANMAMHLAPRRLWHAAGMEAEGSPHVWTPERLRDTLHRHLEGERLVLCANREPYIHERTPDGGVLVRHPASGLVTALEPVMRACSGTWVAHGGGSADAQTVDEHDRLRVPPGEESYVLRRVWLTPEEEQGYYYGFANEGLWPLCHIAHTAPTFRAEDWRQYSGVNRRFAEAVCDEADRPDAIVLVQDYHFALVPRHVRERMPEATVLSFWHIPWPNAERFAICPWSRELLEGMLGASIIGFHTPQHVNNFLESVDRCLEARVDRDDSAVILRGHRTQVRSYPISIEWPHRGASAAPPAAECRARVVADLHLAPDTLIGVGVDRVDYTKGLEERFLAVEKLLESAPRFAGRFVFVQLGAPSRTAIPAYRDLNARLEQEAARINERFATPQWKPIHLLREHHEPEAVMLYCRAAALCYVSSLHDGMNLVAKEFVAARDDEQGVLVLSQFTGAARELREALVVNPYDVEQAAATLGRALDMSPDEQRQRMASMRAHLSEFNVYRWAGRLIEDAARLRRQNRSGARTPTGVPA